MTEGRRSSHFDLNGPLAAERQRAVARPMTPGPREVGAGQQPPGEAPGSASRRPSRSGQRLLRR